MPRFHPDRSWTGRRRTISVVQVENLIRELPGVIECRIVINDWGGVDEVHVLADATRPARAYSRDIQSALAARWNLMLDHRKISVARIRDVPPADKHARMRVTRLGVKQNTVSGRVKVQVELSPAPLLDRLGREYMDPDIPEGPWRGEAEGGSNDESIYRLGAEATVQALNQCLRMGHWLQVIAAERHRLVGHDLVTVLLTYHTRRQDERLVVGTVLVARDDALEAGIRAALAASNRIVSRQMKRVVHEQPGETVEVGDRAAVDEAIAEARARERAAREAERAKRDAAWEAGLRKERGTPPGQWKGSAGPLRRLPKGRPPEPWPKDWSQGKAFHDAGSDAPRPQRKWPRKNAGPASGADGDRPPGLDPSDREGPA